MVNNCIDNVLCVGDGKVFGVFRHSSALTHYHAHIKLTYKVDYFGYYSIERGGC